MTADPLAPLVAALLDRARREAAQTLAQADSEAQVALDEARAQADALLADARAKGAADAAEVLAAERARAEREARAVLLAAQQEAHEHARRAARAAVRTLQDDPVHPLLLDALRTRATEVLGPGATFTPLPDGGIQATHDGQHLQFSLDDLADDLLDEGGPALEELWDP